MDMLADIVVIELETRVRHEMLDVAHVPCDQVVHPYHMVAIR